MTPKKPIRRGSEPKCWWCHKDIPLNTPYRGEAPELNLPVGVGVIVCGPSCKKRPTKEAAVWTTQAIGK